MSFTNTSYFSKNSATVAPATWEKMSQNTLVGLVVASSVVIVAILAPKIFGAYAAYGIYMGGAAAVSFGTATIFSICAYDNALSNMSRQPKIAARPMSTLESNLLSRNTFVPTVGPALDAIHGTTELLEEGSKTVASSKSNTAKAQPIRVLVTSVIENMFPRQEMNFEVPTGKLFDVVRNAIIGQIN